MTLDDLRSMVSQTGRVPVVFDDGHVEYKPETCMVACASEHGRVYISLGSVDRRPDRNSLGVYQLEMGDLVRVEGMNNEIARLRGHLAAMLAVIDTLHTCDAEPVRGSQNAALRPPRIATQRESFGGVHCDEHASAWSVDLPYAAPFRALLARKL